MNIVKDKTFAFGPYIGDFENEVMEFIPHVNWVKDTFKLDKFYVNSHYNRCFLYEKDAVFLPVSFFLTNTEDKQNKHKHELINMKDYNKLIKNFNRFILNNKVKKKDLLMFNINYTDKGKIPLVQKKFKQIHIDSDFPSKIVFIPSKYDTKKNITNLYKLLKNELKRELIVIGDKKCHLRKENIIMKNDDYVENGYTYIMNYINNARLIITPNSVWTFLSNLQRKNVFSWGNNNSLYKEQGIYGFNNEKSIIIPQNNYEVLYKHIMKVIENLSEVNETC